jgi:DNA-binding beta-propeller fold protein YncE
MARVPGSPFGVAVAPGGRWAFASLGSTLGVFRLTARRPPVLVRQLAMPTGQALGVAVSPDGRYVLVADGESGATVVSAPAAEAGARRAVLGELSEGPRIGGDSIEVAVSPDGRYAFVSIEGDGYIAVYNLRKALADGFRPAAYVGAILTGLAPVGLAFSPDGRWLYSTSEEKNVITPASGLLMVMNVAEAEINPSGSVVATVPAGCQPVRVIASADGRVVWVTARGSDAVLAFSAGKLRTDPARALLADIPVGEAPVGIALVRGGTRIVVADSNQYNALANGTNLAVIDVRAALAGRPALLGYLPAGQFPRDLALEPGGKMLLVANYYSGQIEALNVTGLP